MMITTEKRFEEDIESFLLSIIGGTVCYMILVQMVF